MSDTSRSAADSGGEMRDEACGRCGHPADWHRLDDSRNVSPTDSAAEFRCIGYDCTVSGPMPHVTTAVSPLGDLPVATESWCDCPDYVSGAIAGQGEQA